MSDPWCQTRSGLKFDLENPTPQMVLVSDIAAHLTHLRRYCGASSAGVTVAFHAVCCAYLATGLGYPDAVAYAALHHDDGEAYYGDVIGPARRYLGPDWRAMERRVDDAITKALNIDWESTVATGSTEAATIWSIVRTIDLVMLEAERQRWMAPPPETRPTSLSVSMRDIDNAQMAIDEVIRCGNVLAEKLPECPRELMTLVPDPRQSAIVSLYLHTHATLADRRARDAAAWYAPHTADED